MLGLFIYVVCAGDLAMFVSCKVVNLRITSKLKIKAKNGMTYLFFV